MTFNKLHYLGTVNLILIALY